MQMGGNQNERTSGFAQCTELVTETSMLILAFIYVTVLLLEYLLGIPPTIRWGAGLKEE